jgi:hypothetical protein
MLQKIDYDPHGLPMFQSILQKRPDKAGQFTLVYYWDNRPVKSFDIAIVRKRPEVMQPLAVVYEWTGKGFKVGVYLASKINSSDKTGLRLDATEMTLGTAAGFVIGVVAAVPTTIKEINGLIAGNEVLISYSEYTYDQAGRLHIARTFQPAEKPRELVRTEFDYLDNETIPTQTIIYSYPDDKTRTMP